MKAALSTLRRLATAIDYLRIDQGSKHRYDLTIPIVISVALMTLYFFLPIKPSIIGDGSIVHQINSVIQILTGFYIASLAAVATFKSERLDEVMKGSDPATLMGSKGEETLTRRRFLCLLFSYLVTLCFVLIIAGVSAEIVSKNLRLLPLEVFEVSKYAALLLYTFLVSQLIVVTLLGLYYIADKLHVKVLKTNRTIRQLPPEEIEEDEDDEYKPI